MNKKYECPRPHIPAKVKRQVLVEAGHRCSFNHCGFEAYEIHHIDENRENNTPENLIVLCSSHHTLVHTGKVSKKDLREYKKALNQDGNNLNPHHLSANYSQNDLNVLSQFEKILPYDLITFIQNEPFGSFVKREVIIPFNIIEQRAQDPSFRFHDEELEKFRLQIIDQDTTFLNHFSAQSGGLPHGYNYINFNNSFRSSTPEDIAYWKEYSETTCILARNFCNSVLLLREKGLGF